MGVKHLLTSNSSLFPSLAFHCHAIFPLPIEVNAPADCGEYRSDTLHCSNSLIPSLFVEGEMARQS